MGEVRLRQRNKHSHVVGCAQNFLEAKMRTGFAAFEHAAGELSDISALFANATAKRVTSIRRKCFMRDIEGDLRFAHGRVRLHIRDMRARWSAEQKHVPAQTAPLHLALDFASR